MVRNHLKPTFGHYKLSSLTPEMVQSWINKLTDQGFARSSISNFLAYLSGSMQYAKLPCQYIKYNPCTGVKIGRVALKEVYPVCTKENGDILTPESFKYCARVVHYELGLSNFHYHSLRHTHGTILAENGANPKTVMERLGHKNISTTMERYVFNTEKMQQDAIRIFESAII